MAVTLSRRTIVGISLLAATAALGTLVFLRYFLDEDRNPIRVKNHQLRIETEDKDANWKKANAAQPWRLEASGRNTVEAFYVTAYGAAPADACKPLMKASSVGFEFKDANQSHTFTLNLQAFGSKLEPVLLTDASTTLEETNGKKIKFLKIKGGPEGAITSLTIDGATNPVCTFPGDRRVEIEICVTENCL